MKDVDFMEEYESKFSPEKEFRDYFTSQLYNEKRRDSVNSKMSKVSKINIFIPGQDKEAQKTI